MFELFALKGGGEQKSNDLAHTELIGNFQGYPSSVYPRGNENTNPCAHVKARSHYDGNGNGNSIFFFRQEWVTLDPVEVYTREAAATATTSQVIGFRTQL